jgi:chromosome segregation ATPase
MFKKFLMLMLAVAALAGLVAAAEKPRGLWTAAQQRARQVWQSVTTPPSDAYQDASAAVEAQVAELETKHEAALTALDELKRQRSHKISRLKTIEAQANPGSELRIERAALDLSTSMLSEQILAAEEQVADVRRQWADACRNCCLAKYRMITEILETLGPVHDTLVALRKDAQPPPWVAITDRVGHVENELKGTVREVDDVRRLMKATAERIDGVAQATAQNADRIQQRLEAEQASRSEVLQRIESVLKDIRVRSEQTPLDDGRNRATTPSSSEGSNAGPAPALCPCR